MMPSLGIVLTEKCNFSCVYCPPFGENLVRTTTNLCKLESLIDLIEISAKHGVKVVRFTGGEPLLEPERLEKLLKKACTYEFQKIIVNTNGYLLLENINWLKKYRRKFLLKISLDTLDNNVFNEIIRAPNLDLSKILHGLQEAISENFDIEINTVANKYNYTELMDIVKYCQDKNLNLKVFDLFDFGGRVKNFKDIQVNIEEFVDVIKGKYKNIGNERLPGGRGIKMHKFQLTSNKHLLIVCHEGKYSSTKAYTNKCKECIYFPCKTGKFQIPIRADGLMQTCRLFPLGSINISHLAYDDIEKAFLQILKEFEDITIM